MAEVSNSLKKH